MLKTLLLSVLIIAICIVLFSLRIIIKRGGTFSSKDVGESEAMRARGIGCTKVQDREAMESNPMAVAEREITK